MPRIKISTSKSRSCIVHGRQFFLFFKLFSLECNCLQCWLCFCCTTAWINSKYTYILPSASLSLPHLHYPIPSSPTCPPPHPLSVLLQNTELERPVLISRFPPAACFTHGGVNMLVGLPSQFAPPSAPRSVSASPFSMPESLFLPCTWVHQYRFLDSMCMC